MERKLFAPVSPGQAVSGSWYCSVDICGEWFAFRHGPKARMKGVASRDRLHTSALAKG